LRNWVSTNPGLLQQDVIEFGFFPYLLAWKKIPRILKILIGSRKRNKEKDII
jgi:hypothetical protein